jgi:hypothetical protein
VLASVTNVEGDSLIRLVQGNGGKRLQKEEQANLQKRTRKMVTSLVVTDARCLETMRYFRELLRVNEAAHLKSWFRELETANLQFCSLATIPARFWMHFVL